MQRRAAAVLFVFFLVMGASAYSVIAVAHAPPIEVDGATTANGGSTFNFQGTQYQVSAIEMEESSGGGHGGGGGASLAGTLSYNVSNAPYEATIESGDEVTRQNTTYVATMNQTNQGRAVVLTEQFNVEQRLQSDPAVYNTTVTSEGTEYVRYRENASAGNRTLVPLGEYLPAPQVERYQQGTRLPYPSENGVVQANVSQVGNESATLTWTAPKTFERDLEEGSNITLANDETYVVHFASNNQVVLSQNFQQYADEQHKQDVFHERINGLWAVVIMAALAGIIIISLAYMPVRG